MTTPEQQMPQPRASRARKLFAGVLRTLAKWLDLNAREDVIDWQHQNMGDWLR
jgi:hypothetical protein